MDIELDNIMDIEKFYDLLEKYMYELSGYDLYSGSVYETEEEAERIYKMLEEDDGIPCIFEENGKYGIKESVYFRYVAPTYDSLEYIRNTCDEFKVSRDGKYGIVRFEEKEEVVIPIEYDSIEVFRGDMVRYVVEKDGKYQYQGHGLTEWVDEVILPKYAGWVRVRQGEKIGWLDVDLKVTFNKDEAHEYLLQSTLETCLFVKKYQVVTKELLDEFAAMDDEIRACGDEDTSEKEEALRIYSASCCDSRELFTITEDGKKGLKDHFGVVLVPPVYDEIVTGDRNPCYLYYGKKDGKWEAIAIGRYQEDYKLKGLDEPCQCACNGCIYKVKKDGKYGLFNVEADEYLVEPICDELIVEEGVYAITRIGDKYGFYDGLSCIPAEYDDYRVGHCLSYLRLKKDGQWGYIDGDGNWTEDISRAKVYVCNPGNNPYY